MGAPSGSVVRDRPKPVAPGRSDLQRFEVGAFHHWYDFVLGYSDQLVTKVFDTLDVSDRGLLLDPFSGGGTTVVEAAKLGLPSIGVDANPFASFVARVKTRFSVDPDALRGAASRAVDRYHQLSPWTEGLDDDPTYQYIDQSGMLRRGWISPVPLKKALALKRAIKARRDPDVRDALMLALVADLPTNIGNMKFGPQIYKGAIKEDVDLIPLFLDRVERMADDLRNAKVGYRVPSVITGDARTLRPVLRGHFGAEVPQIDFVVCSPPYPTEHDYTRHTRLELAFTDDVRTLEMLRTIKRSMIRSHTKGIYKGDEDADRVARIASVEAVAKKVEAAVVGRESGFEKLYPTVVRAYFGGMRRHFASLYRLMNAGGKAAYVVGDQAAYARVPIQTAELLGEVAESVGFRVDNISHWRQRWASGMSSYLDENILYLSKPTRR